MELQLGVVFIWLLVITQTAKLGLCVRMRDRMYSPIAGASCFRRLNATHQTGCQSAQSGSVGVLHLIAIEEDFGFLLRNPPAPPYAPIIPPHLFTRKNILRLKNEGGKNISVIILINRTDQMTQFSHELNCPNQYSGLQLPGRNGSATCDASNPTDSWNPWGTGLLHEDFPFPIYYVADVEEIQKLTDCFEKFNNFDYNYQGKRSLCAIEVTAFMSAAVNAQVCLRRSTVLNNFSHTKFCDPLESRNVFATLFPRISPEVSGVAKMRKLSSIEKFILITCRIDTTSMFDGVGLGAMDSLLGYATLFNIAHVLHQLVPQRKNLSNRLRNVLFVAFNGESYDYIGSQRFVFDLENSDFPTRNTETTPITLSSIEFMIDLGTFDDISAIKLHSLESTMKSKQFLKRLQNYANASNFAFNVDIQAAVGYNIPPTSAQSFLRRDESFPAVILNAPPKNQYYHSIFDDFENLNFEYGNTSLDYTTLMEATDAFKYFRADSVQMKIRNISTIIALAIYETLTETPYGNTKIANPLLVDEFLYCFLQSADCRLFRASSHPNSPPGLNIPPMRYISVAGAPQEASGWTYRILGFILSNKEAHIPKENCTQLPLHWFAGFNGTGECRLTTQNYSLALSPAFEIPGYNMLSGYYSTWTESTWTQFSARIFLRPSKTHEITVLSFGVVIFIFSFIVIYVVNSKTDILFVNASRNNDASFA